MLSEQQFLRISIAATVVVAALGVAFGILSGSFSIAFDGVYSLGDAAMTGLALWVSSLIVKSAQTDALSGRVRNRFTMGFWHLEPIVLMLNGSLLMTVAVYALINAIISILNGGHQLHYGVAITYTATTVLVCAVMAVIGARLNRRLKSDLRVPTLEYGAGSRPKYLRPMGVGNWPHPSSTSVPQQDQQRQGGKYAKRINTIGRADGLGRRVARHCHRADVNSCTGG